MADTLKIISLLHLNPLPGELEHNRNLIESGIDQSAKLGATWIVTPELASSGYYFREVIGTGWVKSQPDNWLHRMAELAKNKSLNLFISCPVLDATEGKLYNSVFAIS